MQSLGNAWGLIPARCWGFRALATPTTGGNRKVTYGEGALPPSGAVSAWVVNLRRSERVGGQPPAQAGPADTASVPWPGSV